MNDAKRVMLENQRRENHEAAERERERKSPYRDFAQLNREEIPHLDRACRDNPTAVRLLLFIMQHMDHSNTLLCPYQVFEEYLGLSQATVARGIRYLKDKGFIVVEKKSGAGNRYTLNPCLAWTTYGSRLKESSFDPLVALSAATGEDLERARRIRREYMASASLRKDGGA